MTSPYEWSSLPGQLEVKYQPCSQAALFQVARFVKIETRKDIQYFKDSPYFEYRFITEGFGQSNQHTAIFYRGLKIESPESITDLPARYQACDWNLSHFSRNGSEGPVRCSSCGYCQKHVLDWPQDAYYQTEVRGEVLWAYNRASLVALRNYIEATERDKARRNKHKAFLMNVPTHFLTAKIRTDAVKKINKLLSA